MWHQRIPSKDTPFIEGAGSFLDPQGRADISGNTVVLPWRKSTAISTILVPLLWTTFALLFTYLVVSKGAFKLNGITYDSFEHARQRDKTAVLIFLFPAVGLGLLYVIAARLINKTTITFQQSVLNVSRGPLLWIKMRDTIRVEAVRQVFVEVYSSQPQNRRSIEKFRVKALLRDNSECSIESGIRHYSDARILEQWLVARLRIEDQSASGEGK